MLSIAIDGPAGAGKSTIAKTLAEQLHMNYVDTGAMYRGIAYYFMLNQVDIEKENMRKRALETVDMQIEYIQNQQRVILNGSDVTNKLRQEEIGNMASEAAVYQDVRLKLVDLQRKIAKSHSVVMDGRDIGTYVLPDASIKIYLTASSKIRATRRWKELKGKGIESDLKEIEKEIEKRDQRDMNRTTAPLRKAEDAIYVDTDNLSIKEVIDLIQKYIQRMIQDED